jgi:hypothetical protein
MLHGKPAGVPCVQLDEALRCRLFASPDRPAVCASLQPEGGMCAESVEQAMARLAWLEAATQPEHTIDHRNKKSKTP